jgi:hypothetical protein
VGSLTRGKIVEATEHTVLDLRSLEEISDLGSYEQKLYMAALEYIKAGFYVVPLTKNEKKLPEASKGVNYSTASNSHRVIEKWFHPTKGKFAGYNIGIATGRENGVFVVDVDRHGEEDGVQTLKDLEAKHSELPIGPRQATPNGGFHYLFRWQENATNSTNKIGLAIDTRGGTGVACKGHIVAWPSMINGVGYKWITSGPLPSIPQWVVEKMGIAWSKPRGEIAGNGRGNENVNVDDFEKKVPLDQITRMMESIAIDDASYDEWIRVGMAIKSQYPDEDGFELWDDWSSRGYRYEKNECRMRWDGFSDFGTVRMGSLFYMSNESGWKPEPDDVHMGRIHGEIERVNAEYGFTVVGGKAKIIRERKKTHAAEAHMARYDLMDKSSFEAYLENDRVVIDEETGKKISVAKIWLASEARRTYPNGIGLFPEGAPGGYYNTWEGFSVKPEPGECDIFINHIRDIICNGNEDESKWVLDWIADMFQNPQDPKGTAIVMRGGEGTGKGTLANTIGELLGSHYIHLIDDAHLTSNFNAFMMDAVLVFADEITWGGNKKTSGKLKGLVTERFLVCERKGVDAQSFRNMIHMFIASNSKWVIPAGTDSRRWYVTDVSPNKKGNIPYFKKIKTFLDQGGHAKILNFFLNRKITSDLRIAPHTEALQDQRDMSMSSETTANWISMLCINESMKATCLDDTEGWPLKVQKKDLYEDYTEWCSKRNIRSDHMMIFFKELKKLGFRPTKKRLPGGGRVPAVEVPLLETLIESMKQLHNMNLKEEDDE